MQGEQEQPEAERFDLSTLTVNLEAADPSEPKEARLQE